MFGLTMFDVISAIMKPIEKIMTGLPVYIVVVLIMQLLWWFGIHDPNVMGTVTEPFLTKMMTQNLELYQSVEGVTAAGVFYTKGSQYSIISGPFGTGWFSPTGSGITMVMNALFTVPFVIGSNRQAEEA